MSYNIKKNPFKDYIWVHLNNCMTKMELSTHAKNKAFPQQPIYELRKI